ncbi:hypothetical protein [Neisseria sicca]|nr:hypothetical protein [Neisseria sicca]
MSNFWGAVHIFRRPFYFKPTIPADRFRISIFFMFDVSLLLRI